MANGINKLSLVLLQGFVFKLRNRGRKVLIKNGTKDRALKLPIVGG